MRLLAILATLLLAQQQARPPQGAGVVTGQVRTADGQPAVGVRVAILAASQPGGPGSDAAILASLGVTDAAGRYRLENILPGQYYITAGLLDLPTYYPGVKDRADARTVAVSPNSTIEGMDFTLAQPVGVKVSGRVKGFPDGAPAGLVRMTLSPAAPPNGLGVVPREVQVSSDGAFEFLKVPPGAYTLRPSISFQSQTPVQVQDKDVGPLEVSVGRMLVGRVIVEDGSNVPVTSRGASLVVLVARGKDDRTLPLGTGGPDGAFLVLPSFPAGEYKVGARLPFGYSIKSMSYGDVDILRSPLKITADSSSPEASIRVVLTTAPIPGEPVGVKVSGRVAGLSGAATQGLSVSMQTPPVPNQSMSEGRVGETLVQADGTFEFLQVPSGTYVARLNSTQGPAPSVVVRVDEWNVTGIEIPDVDPGFSRNSGISPPPGPMPAPLATQPPSYPAGVKVAGRVSGGLKPHTIVLFGPRDGLSVQGPIGTDGGFELLNVQPGTYDVRTLPLAMPSLSMKVQVASQDLTNLQIAVPLQEEILGGAKR